MSIFKLPHHVIKVIEKKIGDLFEAAKIRLLGPRSTEDKTLYLKVKFDRTVSIPGVFEAASVESGGIPDTETLNTVVDTSKNYIDGLKLKAQNRIVKEIESHIAENPETTSDAINEMLTEEFQGVNSDLERIVESETQATKNTALLGGIVRSNAALGIEDPIVCFIPVKDADLCIHCKTLHLMEDGVTPRVWKLSEISRGYWKKGEETPSFWGLHPSCRCGTPETKLFTDKGIFTLKELYDLGTPVNVVVDNRIQNKSKRLSGFGNNNEKIVGDCWVDRHKSGSRCLAATNVYKTGLKECLEIELQSGHILRVSNDHDVWVDDDNMGDKRKAIDLKIGDKLLLLSGGGFFGQEHFPEIAELMGNLLGDGVLQEKAATWYFFGNDVEYGHVLFSLAKQVSPHFNFSEKMKVYPPDEKYNVSHCRFSSNKLRNIFVNEFGLSKKPRRVPKKIWEADKLTVSSFLRGLFAADGTNNSQKVPGVALTQNDLEFLREIQLLLSNIGINSGISQSSGAQVREISYSDGRTYLTKRKSCWKLHIGGWGQCNRFLNEIGFGVPYKNSKLREILEKTSDRTKLGGWRTSRVKSIKDIGLIETYCLTEPITNTVTFDGVVVGNCFLTTLLPGYGFSPAGRTKFISEGFDILTFQRNGDKK